MLRLHNRYKNLAGLSESTQPPDNSAIDVEKSEPVNISEDCVPPSTYTPYLPAELWLQIINHLRWNTDVYNLSQTSRFLRPIALSTCKTLDLSIFEPIAEFDFSILCASRIPARASIVKELRVTLLCRKGEGTLPECECDIFDRGLELALHAMVNLQDLDITCLLCRASNSTRHAYIITPDAPRQHATQLRTLSFICSGHGHIYPPDENQIDSPLLFDSPLFNSVEVLRWRRWRPRDHPAGSPVKGLPKLKAIASSGKALENTLLATRPIQRLHIVDLYVAYEPFLRALEMSMTSLTHLIHVDLARLNIILSTTRLVFPNLRHIGTLEYNESDLMESCLAPYATAQLTSIDIEVDEQGPPWNAGVLSYLRGFHQNLSKVFVRKVLEESYEHYIWELRGKRWEVRAVLPFSSWGIIRHGSDWF